MSDVSTLTLTEFLLARIAEDEAAARAASVEGRYWGETAAEDSIEMAEGEGCLPEGQAHLRRWLPARVLAECAAKRQIVEDFEYLHADYQVWHEERTEARRLQARIAMAHLASAYADHPDYREEWRP